MVDLEVLGVVDSVCRVTDECERDEEVVKRRIVLAQVYGSLPRYGSTAFWRALQTADIPLEVLVRCFRAALAQGDAQGRNCIVEIIFLRIQSMNEYWAASVLKSLSVRPDERYALMCDLCADLYESIIRALMDPERLFWEENFLHCLYFERKHVYRSLMMREGRWHDLSVKRSTRIPRGLLASLDQPVQQMDNGVDSLDIEDEQAQKMLQIVESLDLLQLVLHLPDKLKAVVLLIFWEGRSEKDTARVLGISDRTVRNRIQVAKKLLRDLLTTEKERASYG